ncbi:MAG: hypothetical protein ABIP55_00595, partial [Tepidisphaeraceae bacterium]
MTGHVCPFCGLTREITPDFDPAAQCPRCTLADTPSTRNATKLRVGPWHVRQVRNPWAPGMRFETLLALVKRGQVTRDSVVRGPTTQQLWKHASEIKGLSREFGLCHACAGALDTQAHLCPHCNRLQDPPANPDALMEMRDSEQAAPSAGAPVDAAAANMDEPASIEMPVSTPATSGVNDPADLLAATHADETSATKPAETSAAKGDVAPAEQSDETPESERDVAAAAENAPQAEPSPRPLRPMAIRPMTPGADDALLTPQELATAFHLGFSPQGAARPRGASKRAGFLLALLLIGGGAAVLFYLRPDLREQALAWTTRTVASARQFVALRTTPAARPAAIPAPTTRSTRMADRTTVPLTKPKPKPVAIAPPVPKVEVTEDDAPHMQSDTPPKQLETPESSKAPPTIVTTTQPAIVAAIVETPATTPASPPLTAS